MLFVDKEGLPSQIALKNLDSALEGTNYRCYAAVLESQYHRAVCISYQVEEFPTLLILDDTASVIHREKKVRNMHESYLRALLHSIDFYRAA